MAIPKASRPIGPVSKIEVEGHFKDERPLITGTSGSNHIEPFVLRRYVEVVGDIYTLTTKGQAFVDYLSEKGYAVDRLNEDVFTPEYISFWEKMKRKHA